MNKRSNLKNRFCEKVQNMSRKTLQKGANYGDDMERKYLKDLIDWMNDEDKKPFLITGARQA